MCGHRGKCHKKCHRKKSCHKRVVRSCELPCRTHDQLIVLKPHGQSKYRGSGCCSGHGINVYDPLKFVHNCYKPCHCPQPLCENNGHR